MSTTVSTLLQVTSTTQIDKTSATRGNEGSSDFQSHLQSATKSNASETATEAHGSVQQDEDSVVSSETSQDGETEQELAEADVRNGTSDKDESKQREELESDTSDVLELSEAIVSYLTYSGEDESSAIIDVSQEIGIVVTEADSTSEGLLEVEANQIRTPEVPTTETNASAEGTADVAKVPDLAKTPSGTRETQLPESLEEGFIQTSATEAASFPESTSGANTVVQVDTEVSSDLQKKAPDPSIKATSPSIDSLEVVETSEAKEIEPIQDPEADRSTAELNHTKPDAIESLKNVELAAEEYFSTSDTKDESSESRNTEPQLGKIEVLANNSQEKTSNESGNSNASSAVENEPIPTGDRARFVQRVSRAFQSAGPGSNEIQLKLSPPELGTLRLSITVEQGVVSAKVETETAAARNILLDNLPALRERLAEQEIRVEKFDVDVGRDGQQSDSQSQFGAKDRQADSSNPRDGSSANRSQSRDDSSAVEDEKEPKQVVTDSNLDVSI